MHAANLYAEPFETCLHVFSIAKTLYSSFVQGLRSKPTYICVLLQFQEKLF